MIEVQIAELADRLRRVSRDADCTPDCVDAPKRASANFADGRIVPLLPVYAGYKEDAEGGASPTWMLHVHPDWDGDVQLEVDRKGEPVFPSWTVDAIPPGGRVGLVVEKTRAGSVLLARHPG